MKKAFVKSKYKSIRFSAGFMPKQERHTNLSEKGFEPVSKKETIRPRGPGFPEEIKGYVTPVFSSLLISSPLRTLFMSRSILTPASIFAMPRIYSVFRSAPNVGVSSIS